MQTNSQTSLKKQKTPLQRQTTKLPYTEWEHNRTKIKQRLNNIHDYIHQAVEIINLEKQKMVDHQN
jgi:hypothetical protein